MTLTLQETEYRSNVTALIGMADRNLDIFWADWIESLSPEETRDALIDVLPALVDTYGGASAAIAADWYDDQRERAEMPGRFTAIPADLGDMGSDVLARWGVAPLFAAVRDYETARTLISGGMQRRIANAARLTITRSSITDPAARGWMRAGLGSCDFCKMLISRGAVYTQASATFASHDHCSCLAVPAWQGTGDGSVPVSRRFVPSPRR